MRQAGMSVNDGREYVLLYKVHHQESLAIGRINRSVITQCELWLNQQKTPYGFLE
jgi:hypothetical protein